MPPAGRSIIDSVANAALNAALYYGLVNGLATTSAHEICPFHTAKSNCYRCAQQGLSAIMQWRGRRINVRRLLLDALLPTARLGLQAVDVAQDDIDRYLGVIRDRLQEPQNGAIWQQRFVDRYGKDMQQLTGAYREQQQQGTPVHTWGLSC